MHGSETNTLCKKKEKGEKKTHTESHICQFAIYTFKAHWSLKGYFLLPLCWAFNLDTSPVGAISHLPLDKRAQLLHVYPNHINNIFGGNCSCYSLNQNLCPCTLGFLSYLHMHPWHRWHGGATQSGTHQGSTDTRHDDQANQTSIVACVVHLYFLVLEPPNNTFPSYFK